MTDRSLPHLLRISVVVAVGSPALGCAPTYVAPAVYAPLYDRAGQIHIGTAVGTQGFDLHGGFSPTDMVGVHAAISTDSGESERDPDTYRLLVPEHSHLYGEVAGGVFFPFGIGRFEVFGGIGRGSSHGEFHLLDTGDAPDIAASGTYTRPSVQIDLGLSTDYFDGAFVNRIAPVFYQFDKVLSPVLGDTYNHSASAVFWESFLVARAGAPTVKAELQAGFVLPVISQQFLDAYYLGWQVFHLSIGIHATIETAPDY